jgi:Tol biopolymer transport system component
MMRTLAVILSLGLVALMGCDRNASSRQRAETLAAAGVAPSLSGPGHTVQDSSPMVVRRIWSTNDFEIWDGPPADGRYLPVTYWVEEGGVLGIHDLFTGETRPVTADPALQPGAYAYAEWSTVSLDGERIAYGWWSEDHGSELRLINADGSEPRVLYHDQSSVARPQAWSRDGESVLVLVVSRGNNRIGLISTRDGSFEMLKTLGRWEPFKVSISPDGRFVIYDGYVENEAQRDIFVITVANGDERRLVQHPSDDLVLGWAPDGEHVLFASDRTGTLGAWLLPVARGRPAGTPRLVKPDLWRAYPLGFASNGSFYYVVSMRMRDVYLATVNLATGQLLDSPSRVSESYFGSNSIPEWSPDGRHVAFVSERKWWSGSSDAVIVIRSMETGEVKELRPALSYYLHPRWSPDGRFLLFRASDEVGRGFFQVDVQTGDVEPLMRFPAGSGGPTRAEWLAGGSALLYWWRRSSEDDERSFRVRNLATGSDEVLYEGDVSPRFAVSPDRRHLAFAARREGRASLMVMPIAGGEPIAVLPDCGESLPSEIQWSPDGRHLYYESGGLWRVPVDGGLPEKLEWFEQAHATSFFRFQPSGQRVALMCAVGQDASEVWVMENFLPSDASGEPGRERRTP